MSAKPMSVGIVNDKTGETRDLYTKPKQGEKDAANDTEIAEPETEGRTIEDREGDVKASTNCPIQDHNNRENYIAHDNSCQCFFPA